MQRHWPVPFCSTATHHHARIDCRRHRSYLVAHFKIPSQHTTVCVPLSGSEVSPKLTKENARPPTPEIMVGSNVAVQNQGTKTWDINFMEWSLQLDVIAFIRLKLAADGFSYGSTGSFVVGSNSWD